MKNKQYDKTDFDTVQSVICEFSFNFVNIDLALFRKFNFKVSARGIKITV